MLLILQSTLLYAEDSSEQDDPAFHLALQKFLPLSPEQIDIVLNALYQKAEATSIPYNSIPTPVTSTKSVSLSPGSDIPLVRLSKGYISSVIFLDQTGQPWPIANYSLGNPEAFDIAWDASSNTLFIQSLKTWSFANIGVRLEGLSTPIMINLSSSQGEIDYRMDLAIPEKGPNAKETGKYLDNGAVIDAQILPYLDGVPPAYAAELVVDPVYARAWSQGPFIFIRTKDTVISPHWIANAMSSDGMKVYKLARTNTVVISRNGSPKTLSIKGF
jgi:intracellular multiplication protein IcmK